MGNIEKIMVLFHMTVLTIAKIATAAPTTSVEYIQHDISTTSQELSSKRDPGMKVTIVWTSLIITFLFLGILIRCIIKRRGSTSNDNNNVNDVTGQPDDVTDKPPSYSELEGISTFYDAIFKIPVFVVDVSGTDSGPKLETELKYQEESLPTYKEAVAICGNDTVCTITKT